MGINGGRDYIPLRCFLKETGIDQGGLIESGHRRSVRE